MIDIVGGRVKKTLKSLKLNLTKTGKEATEVLKGIIEAMEYNSCKNPFLYPTMANTNKIPAAI